MHSVNKFCLGQIVTSDFSGPKRSMYEIIDRDLVMIKNQINNKDLGVVLGHHKEGANNTWVKILTSSGSTGYVPSIWIRPL